MQKILVLFLLQEHHAIVFPIKFFGAVDFGYGISTNGGTGGFYYRPKVGYQGEIIDFFGFYKGISSDGATVGTFGVGAAYKFN